MSVQPVQGAEAAVAAKTARTQQQQATGGASFAGALAEANSAKRTAKTKLVEHPNGDYRAPAKEKTKQVEGHAYVDILNGPRNGLYINTSGNKRHGQTFQLVIRDGKRYHVYGEGKDRLVVCLKPKTAPEKTPEVTAPGAKTAPSGTTGASS